MSVELKMLLWVTGLTAILWIPYIVTFILKYGPVQALTYRADGEPLPGWAQRLKAAHFNAVENLVIFAPLVLIAHVIGLSNEVTVLATTVYFWARVAHVVGYVSNLPLMRSLPFAIAWGACLALFLEILSKS